MDFKKIRLIIAIVIAVVAVISAVRKNNQRERELEAAGVTDDEMKVKLEDVMQSYYKMVGLDGFAISQLAPYGRVMIYGKVFQACCEDCVVEKGDTIEVVGVNERTLIVKKLEGNLYDDEDENDLPKAEDTDKDIVEEI